MAIQGSRAGMARPSVDMVAKNEPSRMPLVPMALDRLETKIAQTWELFSQLDTRLAGVMRPEPDVPKGPISSDPLRGEAVELSTRIDGSTRRVADLQEAMVMMLERLEL